MTASRKVIKDVFCWKQKYFWNQYQPSLICQLFPQSLCIIWRISILENRGPQFESMGCQPLSSVTLGSSICLLAVLKLVWRRSGQGGGTMSVVGRNWVDFSLESWHLIWLLLGQRLYLWGSSNGARKVEQRLGWMVVAVTEVLSWRQWNFTHAFKSSEGSKKSALSLLPFFRGSACVCQVVGSSLWVRLVPSMPLWSARHTAYIPYVSGRGLTGDCKIRLPIGRNIYLTLLSSSPPANHPFTFLIPTHLSRISLDFTSSWKHSRNVSSS